VKHGGAIVSLLYVSELFIAVTVLYFLWFFDSWLYFVVWN